MDNPHLNDILEDNTNVVGEIYIITNTTNNKQYIGQTLSHRLNHGKYRPFGTIGRFKDHISEALCNSKAKQCRYLNNAIRKNGSDKFKVELLEYCEKENLNELEIKYIFQKGTLFPNGYNLTKGGKHMGKTDFEDTVQDQSSVKQSKNQPRSEKTKHLISSRLKERFEKTPELREQRMQQAKQQHLEMKLSKYENIKVGDNLEDYIYPVICQKTQNVKFYKVKIDNVVTRFHGKHSTAIQLKNEALEFLKMLAKRH
jgi:group I intron endonuclease